MKRTPLYHYDLDSSLSSETEIPPNSFVMKTKVDLNQFCESQLHW